MNDPRTELPPLSLVEDQNKRAFEAYMIGLGIWLGSRDVDAVDNPMPGRWNVVDSDGSMTFTDVEFTWAEDRRQSDRNLYRGGYSLLPGARTRGGYALTSPTGANLFSLLQHYTFVDRDGQARPANFYGVFVVEQQDPDVLHVFNERTGSDLALVRDDQRASQDEHQASV